MIFFYVQSRNVIENKWRHETIFQNVYENKWFIKKCRNAIENTRDRLIFDPRNCEKMPQMPLSQNLAENRGVVSFDVSVGQYVD